MDWLRRKFFRRAPLAATVDFVTLEAFFATALQRLDRGSAALTKGNTVDSALRSLPAAALIEMDERLRSYTSGWSHPWPDTALNALTDVERLPTSLCAPLLFFAVTRRDGRQREQALRLLRNHPCYLSLAGALIRCADWAPQIRQLAQVVALELLDRCSAEDVVDAWPLVVRLHLRERVDSQWLRDGPDTWILRPSSHSILRALLASALPDVRHWAHVRCLEAGVDLGHDVMMTALLDADPRISRLALRHAATKEPEYLRVVAEAGLHARHSTIRLESLRSLAGLNLATRDLLHAAMRDRSGGMRALAFYLLRELHGEDARDICRAMLDGQNAVDSSALTFLSERPEPCDAVRLRRGLGASSGRIRAMALRGIVTLDEFLTDAELTALLGDCSTHIQRELFRKPLALDAHRLSRLLSTTDADARLRALLFALGHWRSLSLLLELPANDDARRPWWRVTLAEWTRRHAGRYVPLLPGQRDAMLTHLTERAAYIDTDVFAKVEAALLAH